MSFPPLHPVLIAIWNAVLHSGVYAGVWIDLIVALLTCGALLALGRRIAASDAPGLLAAAALVGNPWYLDEVMSGRAIPVALLLFVLLLLLLHRMLTTAVRPIATAAAAGAVAGLIFETRFDFLLPALAIGAALPGKMQGRFSMTAAYFAGLAAAASPWVLYSLIHFGVPLVSDNARTAMSVESLFILRYVPFPETIATLRNAPFEWFVFKMDGALPTLEALAIAVGASPLPVLAGMWAGTRTGEPRLSRESTIVLGIGWLALLLQLVMTATTGYPDVRYWIGIATIGTFTASAVVFHGREIPHAAAAAFLLFLPAQIALVSASGNHQPDRLREYFTLVWPFAMVTFFAIAPHARALARVGYAALVAVPLAALVAGSGAAARLTGAGYSLRADATARTLDANTRIAAGLDGADPSRARILLAAVPGAPLICEFGARTGIANVLKPTPPLGWLDLWLLVKRYRITHAIVGDPEIDRHLPLFFVLNKSANGALWKIEGERPGLMVIDEAHPASSVPGGLGGMFLVTNWGGPIDPVGAPPRRPEEWSYPVVLVPRN